jgi:hypothetical protein
MPSAGDTPSRPPPSIFISYASQDREASRSLRDTLAAAGFDVWYDESELGGGDAWDQKIRRQIRECSYFMPVISANTEARHEGYFRREWRLAVERTLDMADDVTFVVPVVIDATPQNRARVPDKFLAVQWLNVPAGRPIPAFQAWCARLISGESPAGRPSQAPRSPGRFQPAVAPHYPPFPEGKPDQRVKFFFGVAGWLFTCAGIWCKSLSRGSRRLILLALVLLFFTKECSCGRSTTHLPTAADREKLSDALTAIGHKYDAAKDLAPGQKADLAKIGTEVGAAIAKEFGDDEDSEPPLFAIPFGAPADDAEAAKFSSSVFVSLYGKVAMADSKKIGVGRPGDGAGAPLEQARARHSRLVIFGAVKGSGPDQVLEVTLVQTTDGGVVWTHAYPLKGSDPATVADDISGHLPALAVSSN